MRKTKPSTTKTPEPYWKNLTNIFFKFYHDKFNDVISFDHSQPRDFKAIIVALRKRVEHSNLEWTQERAERMLKVFLEFAYADKWLSENFLPFNLNRQKDKIFFKIKQYQLKQQSHERL